MSNDQSDRPEDAATGDEQAPAEAPVSHRKFYVAVAAVTALAVGLAGVGLAVSSGSERSTSSAVAEPGDVAAIKVDGLVAESIESKVLGGIAGAGAGFAVKLALESGLSALGYQTQEEKTTEQLKEINGRLDEVSNQLTEISSHLDVMSEQIATVGSEVERSIYQSRSFRVDDAIGQINDVYGAYQALLCAKGIAVEQQLNIDSTGSLYNKDNCSESVATYESDFKAKFSAATNARYQLLHEQLMASPTSPSILTDFVKVYVGDRKYFTFKDSVQLRNFATNISEYEALDAYLQSEYFVLDGRKGDAERVLSAWYNNNRAEQRALPPMLPQGFILTLPNGVGPVADHPSLMFTAPTWMGPEAPANLPNNNSVSTVQETLVPSTTQANSFAWNPSIDNDASNLRPLLVSAPGSPAGYTTSIDSMVAPHQVGDACGKKKTAAGQIVIYGCVEGSEGYRRSIDPWTQWGSATGWKIPSSADLKALYDTVRPLAFAEAPDAAARTAGGYGVKNKLTYLASGAGCAPQGSARTVAVASAWCGPGDEIFPGVWSSDTEKLVTGQVRRTLPLPYTYTFECTGGWTVHKRLNLIDGQLYEAGRPRTVPLPYSSDNGAYNGKFAITPLWANEAPPVGEPVATQDEKCILGALLDSNRSVSETSTRDMLWTVRSLTAVKGDDYLAQNAMSVQWPVIQPTGPSNLGTFFPDPSKALVTWQFPLSDGGAPITSYKVTASPAAGGGTAKDCPIVYRQSDGAASFEAECTGLTAGNRYSFQVTATNTELLSGSASVAGPSAAPA